jgi:hypothetical protein
MSSNDISVKACNCFGQIGLTPFTCLEHATQVAPTTEAKYLRDPGSWVDKSQKNSEYELILLRSLSEPNPFWVLKLSPD